MARLADYGGALKEKLIEGGGGEPPERLTLAFPTADVVLLGEGRRRDPRRGSGHVVCNGAEDDVKITG